MPSTSRPEAVSSRFSVTETSVTLRRRSRARMATWSSMLRARRSILWTTTASMSPSSAMRASISCSWGRSAVRADSPRSTYSSTSSQPFVADVADAGLALGGDGEAFLALAVLGLLVGGDPQVDHAAHDRPPFLSLPVAGWPDVGRSDLDSARSASRSPRVSSARATSARASPASWPGWGAWGGRGWRHAGGPPPGPAKASGWPWALRGRRLWPDVWPWPAVLRTASRSGRGR